jgi:hypothetical protein
MQPGGYCLLLGVAAAAIADAPPLPTGTVETNYPLLVLLLWSIPCTSSYTPNTTAIPTTSISTPA